MMSRRAAIGLIALGFSAFTASLLTSVAPALAQAENYPNRPVRWVVGYPPGAPPTFWRA